MEPNKYLVSMKKKLFCWFFKLPKLQGHLGGGGVKVLPPLDGLVMSKFKPYHKLNLDCTFLGLL